MKNSSQQLSTNFNFIFYKELAFFIILLSFSFTNQSVSQDYPAARFLHTIAADESNLYIFGGFEATEGHPGQQGMTGDYDLGNSFWAFSFDALGWTNLSSDTDPDVRCAHSMGLWSDGSNELVLFGGRSEDDHNNHRDTWRSNLGPGGWENTHAMGSLPANLAYSASAVIGGRWFLSGGYQNYNSEGTQVRGVVEYTYMYSKSTNSWEYLSCQNTPPGVQRASGFGYDNKFWRFGGKRNDGTLSNGLYSLDPTTNTWTDHTPANPGSTWPCARYDQQAVVIGDELHITGGYANGDLNDHWVYDFESGECTKKEDLPEEVQLRNSKAVAGPGETIYYFGGEQDNEPLDNFYKLEDGEKWSKFDKQGKRWKRVGTKNVFLNMSIDPAEAAENGCNVEPSVGEHEYEEGAIVDLKATENAEKGWYFLNWTGVPGGTSKTTLVTMNEDKDAVAHFKEVKLVVTGLNSDIFCRCDIEESPKIVNLTRMTALGDDWMVNSLTINALEGSGDEVNQISSVFVTFGNAMIAEGHFTEDDGSITLTLDPAISIPENETFTVAIHYEFKNITQEELEEEVLRFKTEVNAHGSPVHYETGIIEGQGKGFAYICRVWNEWESPFASIEEALHSMTALSTDSIMLCPEEFHENVYFGNATTMLTPERFGEKRATIIDGGDDAATITLTGESANFKRIIIKSHNENCIATSPAYDNTPNLSLESCSLLSGPGFNGGLSLVHLKNLTVKNCDFQGGFSGIFSEYSSTVSIDNCQFSNSEIGINLVRCNEITISNSSITSCNLEGVRIFDSSLDYKVALSNVHESNSKYGFAISDISSLSITNCSAKSNQIAGFELHDVSLFSISGCLASFNKTPEKAIGTGIELSDCQYGTISNNNIFQNCSGIEMKNSFNITLSGNKITNSTCWNTGISINNASPVLKGNVISNNHGAGILATNGAEPIIIGNNIDGNTVGVENQDPAVQLQASGNYWGTNNGPGEQDYTGVINVDEWLNSQVELVASFGADTLFLLPRTTDTITLYLNNLESETDLLQVSWSDEQGWIQGDVRGTVEINDTGGTQEIQLDTPAEDSPANLLAITAQSINEPERTVRDTVVLVTYHPELSVLTAFPDSMMLKPGDSLQLTATGYDQHNYTFEGEWVWTSTSGSFEPQGLLVCPESEGEITVTLTDRQTGQDTQVRFYCTNEEETVQNIIIKPRLDSLTPDMSISFDIRAWNQFGFPTDCQPEWTCEGGSIDESGSFSAGDELGWFTITATDPNSGVTGTCQVKIVTSLGKQQIQLNQNILLYPNPAGNTIRISNLPATGETIEVNIINALGQTIKNNSVKPGNNRTISLDIRDLPKGLYFIRVNTTFAKFKSRFIKE